MSQSEIQRFFKDMANDAGLVEAARTVVRQPADLAAFATEHGYSVDAVDIEQAIRAMSANGGALSDEQLETVAGGDFGGSFFPQFFDWVVNTFRGSGAILG